MTHAEWYADGLRFECTQCGRCCSGPTGFVWFSEAEARALAAELAIPLADFMEQYTREIHGRRSLQERLTPHGHDCIFLDRESAPGKAVCSVYRARPLQCRTWPFWPENLAHPRDWQRTGRTCPGVDRGRLYPIEAIRIERDRRTE